MDVGLDTVKFFFVNLRIVNTSLIHLLQTRVEVLDQVNQLLLAAPNLLQPLLYGIDGIILKVVAQLILLPIELDHGTVYLLRTVPPDILNRIDLCAGAVLLVQSIVGVDALRA